MGPGKARIQLQLCLATGMEWAGCRDVFERGLHSAIYNDPLEVQDALLAPDIHDPVKSQPRQDIQPEKYSPYVQPVYTPHGIQPAHTVCRVQPGEESGYVHSALQPVLPPALQPATLAEVYNSLILYLF